MAMEDSLPWFVGEGNEEKRRWQTSTDTIPLRIMKAGVLVAASGILTLLQDRLQSSGRK